MNILILMKKIKLISFHIYRERNLLKGKKAFFYGLILVLSIIFLSYNKSIFNNELYYLNAFIYLTVNQSGEHRIFYNGIVHGENCKTGYNTSITVTINGVSYGYNENGIYSFTSQNNEIKLEWNDFGDNMVGLFHNCRNITKIDLSNFNTSSIIKMNDLFSECSSLTEINFGEIDTNKVNNMHNMFYGCHNLRSIDLSHFNTTNVNEMSYMFNGCSKLTSLNLSTFNTAKVNVMHNMFNRCSLLESLNLSNFVTSTVTHMEQMFKGCSNLKSLNLANFNICSTDEHH